MEISFVIMLFYSGLSFNQAAQHSMTHLFDISEDQLLKNEYELKRKRNNLERDLDFTSQQINRLRYAQEQTLSRLNETYDQLHRVQTKLN